MKKLDKNKVMDIKQAIFKQNIQKVSDDYIKNNFSTKCPNCGRNVDTLIITNGHILCPFCQKMNILDLFSVLSKVPETQQINNNNLMAGVALYTDKQKENNAVVKAPVYDSDNNLKKFGSITFFISDKVLKDVKKFKKTYTTLIAFVKTDLIEKYFGQILTLTSKNKKDKK